MVNLLVRRNNLEPHGHPGNAIIRVEGPEPSTATVLTIPSGDYQYKLVTGLELDRWYHFYAEGPADAAGHYHFSVLTRDDISGAPTLNNPVRYPLWVATKWNWMAPFDVGRITSGSWNVGSQSYVPAGKTEYVTRSGSRHQRTRLSRQIRTLLIACQNDHQYATGLLSRLILGVVTISAPLLSCYSSVGVLFLQWYS
jgi:hypothetical protein